LATFESRYEALFKEKILQESSFQSTLSTEQEKSKKLSSEILLLKKEQEAMVNERNTNASSHVEAMQEANERVKEAETERD
jgi:hypothetical protein